jgi:hypothetical protein
MIKDAVKKYPLSLATLKDEKLIKFANDILPYETGIEIECDQGTVNNSDLREIEGVVEVDCSCAELRIRLEPGIKGMIALYNALEYIKENTVPNYKSGIHYHIDCRDLSIRGRNVLGMRSSAVDYIRDNHSDWILKAMDMWKYQGTYNKREVSAQKTMVKLHLDYHTMEFRIGEMSFDYSLIIKRIINCQNIVRVIKRSLSIEPNTKYPMAKEAFDKLVEARHKKESEYRERKYRHRKNKKINRLTSVAPNLLPEGMTANQIVEIAMRSGILLSDSGTTTATTNNYNMYGSTISGLVDGYPFQRNQE